MHDRASLCINSVDEVSTAAVDPGWKRGAPFPRGAALRPEKNAGVAAGRRAVHSRVAERLGISDEVTCARMLRDIVVFDLPSYSDHPALFAQEPRQATGVEQLLINGSCHRERSLTTFYRQLVRTAPERGCRRAACPLPLRVAHPR